MARKRKSEGNVIDISPTPKARTQAEILDEHFEGISQAKNEEENAAALKSAASGRYRNLLKAFKKAGGDVDALTRALALRKLDPNDVDRQFRNINTYLRYMKMPVGTQLGLFNDGESIATKIENDASDGTPLGNGLEEKSLAGVEADGFEAGFNGKNADTNPHEDGSPAFLRWAAGWRNGQEKIAERMAPVSAQPEAAGAPA